MEESTMTSPKRQSICKEQTLRTEALDGEQEVGLSSSASATAGSGADGGPGSRKLFQKMTSFTRKDKLLRMASSPAEISKYEQNNVNISPRDRSVEFNTDGGPRNVGDLLSTNDDEDEVADDEEEVAEGVSQLWERRITRMIADNGITRVDLRRLRLEAFPMDLLQEAKLVSTEFESMDESLASSSSMLESRLQKGKISGGRTKIRVCPATFIEVLDLRHNRISCLPDNISRMRSLRVLSLAHNRLNQLPQGLFGLSNLQTLDLSFNKIAAVPGEDSILESMVSLKNLLLDSNELVSLPSSLNKLTALQFLSVRRNSITSNHIASDLSGMSNLEGLDISSNKLGEIPRQLCAFPKLRFLSLADNQLTYIREEIPVVSLTSLTSLDISNNMLSEIGPNAAHNLSSLPNLAEFRLVNNDLQELPESLKTLLSKGILFVEGNRALFGSDNGEPRNYKILERNRSLRKKASTQDIREFLGVLSTAGSRNSVNVFVNPLAIESPLPSINSDDMKEGIVASSENDEGIVKRSKTTKEKTSLEKGNPKSSSKGKGKEKVKATKRRLSTDSRQSNRKSVNESETEGEWRNAWKRDDNKTESENEAGSGYESSKFETSGDESQSSSESSSSVSPPSSGIKKKGKAILEFISRDRIKREDEAAENQDRNKSDDRLSRLWRKGSREKITERINHITNPSESPFPDDWEREMLTTSQLTPRSLAQGLVLPCAGWRIETPQPHLTRPKDAINRFVLEEEANYSFAYRDLFYPNRHINFMGFDPDLGPVIVSILKDRDIHDGSILYLMRRDQGTVVGHIPAESYKRRRSRTAALLTALKKTLHPSLLNTTLVAVKGEGCRTSLLKLEEQMLVAAHKFGVIFARENQITENELFSNREGDDDFEEFLKLLGSKIELEGWKGYSGGLDTGKNLADGAQSVFAQWKGLDIMFHVSTMIPFNPKDEQQIGRKRHIGNDVVVLVFVSGKTPFSPISIQSQFNNVFVVVQHVPQEGQSTKRDTYKVAVTVKSNIPEFGPALPDPPIFDDPVEFREFLFTKLVNSERAAYKRNQLGVSIKRTRNVLLCELIKKHAPEKYDSYDADQVTTRYRSQSDPAAAGRSSSGNAGPAERKTKRKKNTTLPSGITSPFLFSSSEKEVPVQLHASSSSASPFLSASTSSFLRSDSSPRKASPVPPLPIRTSTNNSSSGTDMKSKSPRLSPGGHLTPVSPKRNSSRAKIDHPAPSSGSNSPRTPRNQSLISSGSRTEATNSGISSLSSTGDTQEGGMKFWKKRKKRSKSASAPGRD